MCVCDRVSVQGREPRSSYLYSFSQQVFIDYQVSRTLLCGQNMVLNRIGINVFMWWLIRRSPGERSVELYLQVVQ